MCRQPKYDSGMFGNAYNNTHASTPSPSF